MKSIRPYIPYTWISLPSGISHNYGWIVGSHQYLVLCIQHLHSQRGKINLGNKNIRAHKASANVLQVIISIWFWKFYIRLCCFWIWISHYYINFIPSIFTCGKLKYKCSWWVKVYEVHWKEWNISFICKTISWVGK